MSNRQASITSLSARQCVLLELADNGPGAGVGLDGRITKRTNGRTVLSLKAIYRALKDLERADLIVLLPRVHHKGYLSSKVYKTTAKGNRAAVKLGAVMDCWADLA